jgi:hypothetical protein
MSLYGSAVTKQADYYVQVYDDRNKEWYRDAVVLLPFVVDTQDIEHLGEQRK